MSSPVLNPQSKRLIHCLVLWAPLWIGTTFAFGLLGAIYGIFLKQDQWLASQALLVREEANGAPLRQGRFDSETQMKAAQETILEVARNHQVVGEALKAVGPQKSWFSWLSSGEWPTKSAIEQTATRLISMRAPKGAEFGATEVIYLDVKQPTPQLASVFISALCDALETRLQQVRKARAESIVAELSHARDAAREQLKVVTEQLTKLEKIAGVELSDLRGMTETIVGGGNSRIQLDQLKSELRAAETHHLQLVNDLKLLQDAIADPAAFLVAPSSLVSTQPGLKRLREGYADAQLNASQLAGKFTDFHPLLVAARETQESIRRRFIDELEASLATVTQDITNSQTKMDRLIALRSEAESKLGGLADTRAEYANILSEFKTRTTILEGAERELAEAEASSEGAIATSLISRMDGPIVSDTPIGPGTSSIAGGCAMAGLLLGLGIVFLVTPGENGTRFGRRATDFRRRNEDQHNTASAVHSSANPPTSHPHPTADSSPQHESERQADHSDYVDRVSRTLALTEMRREKPAPILYDENNLPTLKRASEPFKIPTDIKIPDSDASELTEAEHTLVQVAELGPPEEHPKDSSFRDYLMAEINKTGERRQHPRPAQTKPPTATLGMRSAPPKKPAS